MYSTNGRMRKNLITKKPFIKRKHNSNKHFDTVKTMVYCQRISHTQRFIPEINKTIFGYLWKGSAAEPIARETLFLPRDRGDLGILVPLIQGQSLRTKSLIQLERKNNNILGIFQDTQL